MATSGPGALNLVTAIADAKMDSIPLIAITGQVGTPVIGSDAFQETPIVEVCRGITKHHYLVTNVNDVARVKVEKAGKSAELPLQMAAKRGHVEVVKTLLATDTHVDLYDPPSIPALCYAA